MYAYTSKASGDWSAGGQTTWNEPGVPTAGDTVTIATGHTVTISANTTVGTDPADQTTIVLQINGGLTVNTGATLTVKGNIAQSGSTGTNGRFTLAAGSALVYDGRTAGIKYKHTIGAQHSTTARLIANGTSGSHVSISSAGSGSTNAWFSNGSFTFGGLVECDYTDFLRVGDATNNCLNPRTTSGANSNFYLRNCTFTSGGVATDATAVGTNANVVVQSCVWSDTKSTNCLYLPGASGGAGTRTINNNRFDKPAVFQPITGWNATENYFAGDVSITNGTPGSFQYNIIGSNAANRPSVMVNNYAFDPTLTPNAHTCQFFDVDCDWSGLIFDLPSGVNGDLCIAGSTGSSRAASIKNCIVVANSLGESPGELVSPVGGGYTYTVEHNTVIATRLPGGNSESGVGVYGETFIGTAGMYASLRSNYVYSPTGKGSVLLRHNQGLIADAVASSGGNVLADYNGFNAPITSTGSGVQAVYGPSGGYCDTNGSSPTVRIVGGSTGSFTLLCYHSDGVTTAETGTIAYNAAGATVATAIQSALNTLSDGTYAVTSTGGTANSSTGSSFTITRNASAISQGRIYTILRAGATNTTLGTVNTTREMFSSTTGLGVHDVTANANFVDVSRNMATFDTAYLLNTAADGAWASGVGYTVGQILSSSDSTCYGGVTINYRCVTSHTSASGDTTNGKPGASATTSWRTNWELASAYRIRSSSAVYSAGVRQATPRDLYEWVKAGWAPTNAALRAAAHDGGDIGAVAWVSAGGFGLTGGGPLTNPLISAGPTL